MDYIKKVSRAISFIEKNLEQEIRLSDIARKACLSEFHFHRIFSALVGCSVGEYIRKRRLSRAAEELLVTRTRVIEIAVGYCFGSQESFTRAFKKQFGVNPAQYRKQKKRSFIFEKKEITEDYLLHLEGGLTMEPRIVTKETFKVIGMQGRTTLKDNKIPQLWQDFIPRMEEIQNRTDKAVSYGICMVDPDFDIKDFTDTTEFTELVAVEVNNFDFVPQGMVTQVIERQKYAVFTHKGSLANLRMTYDFIYGTWLHKSGMELAKTVDFEYYDSRRFNPIDQENSEFDIYIPIK